MKKQIIVIILIILAVGAAAFYVKNQPSKTQPAEQKETKGGQEELLAEPMEKAQTRITKKPFGIYISPASSPVQPEKFTGYHTGTDFEVTTAELNKSVAVSAICEGQIVKKEIVSGYGGVMVQSCTFRDKTINVIYGHLNIEDSATKQLGASVKKGEFIANLGADQSAQTSGERKHLHLGIYKGGQVDLRGYVDEKSELSAWLNYKDYS